MYMKIKLMTIIVSHGLIGTLIIKGGNHSNLYQIIFYSAIIIVILQVYIIYINLLLFLAS